MRKSQTFIYKGKRYKFWYCSSSFLEILHSNGGGVCFTSDELLKLHPLEWPGIYIPTYLKKGIALCVFKKGVGYNICTPTISGFHVYISDVLSD